jgi:hypothetical protein
MQAVKHLQEDHLAAEAAEAQEVQDLMVRLAQAVVPQVEMVDLEFSIQ